MRNDRDVSIDELAIDLGSALSRFEWSRTDAICAQLVQAVHATPGAVPVPLLRALSALRRARRFGCLARLTEALIHGGRQSSAVWRAYAQALIEQDLLVAAEHVLREAVARTPPDTPEASELQGLIGRVLKQWYLKTAAAPRESRRDTLQRAIDAYLTPYRANPAANYWQGINVVALVERGRRDGFDVSIDRNPAEMAGAILAGLEASERERPEVTPWELATMLEAAIALGRTDTVDQRAQEYVAHPAAGAFEVVAMLRQLVDIWNLTEDTPPGSLLLPTLSLARARLLREEGGGLRLAAHNVAVEHARTIEFERVHGFDRFQTLQWYRRGLECCSAVARIETESGRGIGTGWLVSSHDWPRGSSGPLLVTNAHVVCPIERPCAGALHPGDAIAHFKVAGIRSQLGDVVWSSPVEALDCTVVALKNAPPVQPLEMSTDRVTLTEPPPRLYIIGHPGGRDVEFSLQDNLLVGCNDHLLHYRTPTEGGSSGSPVFDDSWHVVALHHAGDSNLVRLDGQPGTYEANEGIAIAAVLQAASAAAPIT